MDVRLSNTSTVSLTLALVLCLAIFGDTGVRGARPDLELLKINCGLSSSDFTSLNENDAKAAFNVYAAVVGEEMGYNVTFLTTVYREKTALERDLEKKQIELLSVEVAWYVQEDVARHVTPALVPEESPGVVLDTYILVSRKEGEVSDLKTLKGSSLLYLEHQDANLARIWLDVALMDHGLGRGEKYLGSMKQVHKASAAILPVFFGKIDACVVDRSTFDLMCELNPQIGVTLGIISESPPVLDTVLCLNPSGSLTPSQESNLSNAMLSLQDYPQGDQILTMFGISGFVPFKEEYLVSAREILLKHASHQTDPPERTQAIP